jgi:tetratricopeptide (TPR) repeat protein/transcriptional regulator with XRE-family HTH domain
LTKAARAIPNQRLVNERLLRHWSQQELANRVGTTSINVSRWERGITTPGPYFQQRLCTLFEKSASALGLIPEALDSTTVASDNAHNVLFDPAIPLPLSGKQQLVGRNALLAQIRQRLCTDENVALTALNGLPGVGKTALAIALAHDRKVQEHFCDGILWAGLGPRPNLLAQLGRWARLLGLKANEMEDMDSLEAWAVSLRSLIDRRKMLLIIDDAWQIEDALAFRVGGLHCAYLLTTRFPEVAHQFADEGAIPVGELSEDDGILLLERFVPQVVETRLEEVRALVQAVGGLPLAMTLMGKYLHLQVQSSQPRRLEMALARLRSAEERLRLAQPLAPLERSPNLPSGTSLSLQAAIAISDQQLDEPAQDALRSLSVFPAKPDTFSEEAALAVTALPPDVLDRLSDAGLLESSGPGRYTLHQTIADYAGLQQNGAVARKRLVEYVADYVEMHEKEYGVLERDMPIIFAALHIAFDQSEFVHLTHIVNAFAPFLEARGMYDTAELHLKRARQTASSLLDAGTLCNVLLHLGRNTLRRGDYSEAEAYYQEGLVLARQHGLPQQLCSLLANLGRVIEKQGAYRDAERYLQEGLLLAQQHNYAEQLSDLLDASGVVARLQGDYARAETYWLQGLALARKLGSHEHACRLLSSLGKIALSQGAYTQAEAYWQESLLLARQMGHREMMMCELQNLGLLAYYRGELMQVETYTLQGLRLARQIGERERIVSLLHNLGGIYIERGDFVRAETCLQEGLMLVRQVRYEERLVGMLRNLGETMLYSGNYARAETYLQEGLTLARELKHPELTSSTLMALGEVAAACGDSIQAETYLQEGLALARQIGILQLICSDLFRWGGFCLTRQRIEAAETAFREMLDQLSEESMLLLAQARYGLARVASAQGNNIEACKFGEMSLASFEKMGHRSACEVKRWLEGLPITK